MAKRPDHTMSLADRAKQFLPFSALRGLNEALAAQERIVTDKIELSEEAAEELDRKIRRIQKGMLITLRYFDTDTYLQKTGMVARLDKDNRFLQLVDTRIPFDDIYDISFDSERINICRSLPPDR